MNKSSLNGFKKRSAIAKVKNYGHPIPEYMAQEMLMTVDRLHKGEPLIKRSLPLEELQPEYSGI